MKWVHLPSYFLLMPESLPEWYTLCIPKLNSYNTIYIDKIDLKY